MVSAHWISSGASTAITSTSQPYAGITLTIPAGGVLKRFVVYDCFLSCYLTTADERGVWPLHVNWELTYFSTSYPSRDLYVKSCDVGMEVYTYYDNGLNPTQPHAIFHAADNTMGFEGKTSYGGVGKASATLQLTGNCVSSIPYTPPGYIIQGIFSANLKALYYL